MNIGTIYKADGEVKQIAPKNENDFKLDELQAIVGGNIQLMALPKSGEVMVMNEEGMLLDLPKNEIASGIWRKAYPIAEFPINNAELVRGDVLICRGELIK